MTKVTLAYPVEGLGQTDDTVDVDDARAKNLVRDGLARAADNDKHARAARTRNTKQEEAAADGR